jgi:hypothetical protein
METKEFVVIDHEGQVSMGLKKNDAYPESFATKKAADKRASELAAYALGETIYVCQTVSKVVAPVGKVMVTTTSRYKDYTKITSRPAVRARR